MKKIFYILSLILVGSVIGLFTSKYFLLHEIYDIANNEEIISMNHTRPINKLKKLVMTKGDTLAFKELDIAYLNVDFYSEEYLLYSIIMANKYHYPYANYEVYYCLTSLFELNDSIGDIDEKTKEMALSYLQKGVELNDYHSLKEMAELYLEGKYVKKDTILGKKLLNKFNLLRNKLIERNKHIK